MKPAQLLLILSGLLAACSPSPRPASPPAAVTTPFFPSGVYAAFNHSDYCRTWDTLTISADRRQLNVYRVTRSTVFQRNLEEVYFPVERNSDTWRGSFDPAKALLQGYGETPCLYFQPSANTVLLDDHLFTKIE